MIPIIIIQSDPCILHEGVHAPKHARCKASIITTLVKTSFGTNILFGSVSQLLDGVYFFHFFCFSIQIGQSYLFFDYAIYRRLYYKIIYIVKNENTLQL